MIDIKLIKKPYVWAVVIPAVLGIWVLGATVKMLGSRDTLQKQSVRTKEVQKNAQGILKIIKESGGGNLPGAAARKFSPVTSARACAQAALMPESRLIRLESAKPSRQKDGSFLHRETYKLNKVHLLQVTQFMDFAERNYAALNCTQLTLSHVRGKTKDSWDATISLQYLEK